MAVRCCHPILIWMVNFLIIISTTCLALVMMFTTFSSRPKTLGDHRSTLTLTTNEKCAAAHMIFTILAAVFIHAAMKLVSTGGHRDWFYRIEKDFKILCGLALACTLIVAVLGVVIYVHKESVMEFPDETRADSKFRGPTTVDAIAWYRGSTDKPPKEVVVKETRHSNVQIYVLYLLIADLVSFLLTILGVVTIIGCNKREKGDVEDAVERAMMSRASSRAALSHRSREYL